jgi:SWI/SNF-related matrix-associated actin-dependent regulator 1 of chromatin subfamily A
VIAMTGSPISNHLKDSYALFKLIGHPVAANKHKYEARYCDGHDRHIGRGRTVWTADGATNIEELRRIVAPVFLQRKKADVLKELPAKQRTFLSVEIDTKAYNAVIERYRQVAREKGDDVDSCVLQLLTEQRMATATAKVKPTIDFVENAIEQGDKLIIFSKSTKVLDEYSKHFGDRAVRLDGSMSQKKRQDAVDDFQGREEIKVFLGQIDAAGVGLTLTAANHVVFNDIDWVPGPHLQAEDRAHRIGQTRNLRITYMVADGTIDDDIAPMLAEKLGVISTFEDVGEAPLLADLRKAIAARLKRDLGLAAPGEGEAPGSFAALAAF